MTKSNVFDWDTTAANNTDAGGISCAEGMLPSNVNNWMREVMAQLVREIANKGSTIASASTTDLAGSGTSAYVHVSGSTGISALGTAPAGTRRWVVFDSTPTISHNATSLILPSGTNITAAAGDCALFASEGSGNWRCLFYQTASGNPVGGFSSVTATSTDAGATAGPDVRAYRNSASPAASDLIGRFLLDGRDSAANQQTYASLEGKIIDATSGSEDAEAYLKTVVAGTLAARLTAGQGIQVGAPTGGDPGAGKVNATGYQINGAAIGNIVLQRFYNSLTGPQGSLATNTIPSDTSTPLSSEGTLVFSQAVTPKSATSKIVLSGTVCFGVNTASVQPVLALFSGTTCIAVFPDDNDSSANNSITFEYEEASGSTSARTYSVRFGTDSGTSIINGDGGSGGTYGSKIVSSMTIEEVL